MEYTIRDTDTFKEIRMKGSFTFADNGKVRDLAKAFGDNRQKRSVIALEGLESIDSAGLGMLIVLNDAADENGTALSLRGAKGQVKKMLEITEFDSLIRIEQ